MEIRLANSKQYYRLCLLSVLCYSSFVGNYVECDERRSLKISFLISTTSEGKLIAGAFFSALDYINSNFSIKDYRLDYLFNDTKASSLNAINVMTSHYGAGTVAFIGPDVSCMCESTVAAAWNLPMIGYKCYDSKTGKLEKNVIKRTFARTQPSTSKVSKSIIAILQYHKWERFTIVVGMSPIWNETTESLMELSKLNNIYVNQVSYFKQPYAVTDQIHSIVANTHLETRIYVFLGDYHGLIDFVRELKSVLKDDVSNYVVIAVDDRLYTDDSKQYLIKTPFESQDDLKATHAKSFETVLLLVPRPPNNTKWEAFLDDVRQRNTKEPINGMPATYGDKPISVPIYAAYLFDAVITYAKALVDVIDNNGSITNGTAIVEHIRNKTYTSILGYEIYIDMQGDAEGNYTLLTFDVHQEDGKVDIVAAGNFSRTQSGLGIPELNFFNKVQWKNGYPPVDRPACGFHNENCIKEFDWRFVTSGIVVAVLLMIFGGFFLRHYLYEQKLARLLWKIDFKDIVSIDSDDDIIPHGRLVKRRRSKGHPFRYIFNIENESERANLLVDTKKDGSSTASDNGKCSVKRSYKGTIVAVKHILKKNVVIDRDLKKQLQLRKELNHDNIARFIGACVETPHVYIVTQFCQRGSIHDILQNEDFNFDIMFMSSLVSDLIKGMIFIHDSEIETHGNLKSSNCLVDARWVLMVSDFGLHKLANDLSETSTDIAKNYDSLLWKAPELLHSSSRDPVCTQKGDVYAFALILYEMIGRKPPWERTEYSSKEIVERLKIDPSFKPDISVLHCESYITDCIQECWQTDAEQRPDFKIIRGVKLKSLLQEIKPNILDNMIDMMEKYSNNLESLVTERTELLSYEKKMTENLLLRMLPRLVADRLKKGEPVVPELYDCVSIYFSDIVGFTALSAESTPMEVVCMLNDLYTCFDDIVENYDAYKIETIGDAYFVVSGLPLRNDDRHAGEIASMSLHMLREIKKFKIRHRPNDTLKLRIGLHSGPCVAGVVGLKMPRYTLFGDTVNTASRMESTGVPLKIHCSEAITNLLIKLGGYHLVKRGFITAKGKGEMLTYFLEDEDASHRQRRISNSRIANSHSSNELGDLSPDMFGAPTIQHKYWFNGSIITPTEENVAFSFHENDTIKTSDNKAICDDIKAVWDEDKDYDNLFDSIRAVPVVNNPKHVTSAFKPSVSYPELHKQMFENHMHTGSPYLQSNGSSGHGLRQFQETPRVEHMPLLFKSCDDTHTMSVLSNFDEDVV